MISAEKKLDFERQGYRVVGNHSLVKVCEWTKKAIKGVDTCYKCQFYGINSWRCVQMSPTHQCDHRCVFCWRDTKYAHPTWQGPVDDPVDIIDGCIREQVKYLQGFGGNPFVDKQRLEEMKKPIHFAISLTGEPTMYPRLPELIAELRRKKISSYLVTNGTIPTMVKQLVNNQPTQLYVSLYGPTNEIYQKSAMPIAHDSWERLQETLQLLPQFSRTVIRMTLTKGYTMVHPELYAEMFKTVRATFYELKGYMWVGHSRERLEISNMPSHQEIQQFAQEIIRHNPELKILDEKEASRVVLLARGDFDSRIMSFTV
ncbi:4-demethylwyosine synthase TYW1 [Candidatus Woesearchaeota archaeon]|nr:4-demethylwyosine synthase TYW1 [Candidatus Woesearchaeota archaeon]